MLNEYRLFWSQWRRRFVETGAMAPSSRLLARTIARPLARRRPARPIRVLEVGAGTGAFTRLILRLLTAGDTLEIYEINPEFCAVLRRLLEGEDWRARGVSVALRAKDIRLLDEAGEQGGDRAGEHAGEVAGERGGVDGGGVRYDFIVCGLPLNNFAPADVDTILRLLLDHLTPEGVFSYFEYLWLRDARAWLVRPGPEKERLLAIGAIMRAVLRRHQFRADGCYLNFPPATTHHLQRAPVAV